jgi:hypothetical protein
MPRDIATRQPKTLHDIAADDLRGKTVLPVACIARLAYS